MELADATLPAEQNVRSAPGSIANVVARLFRWARRAPKGLARVEYDNEFARQAVVRELRRQCAADNIPFHEIELPVQGRNAAEVIFFFEEQLSAAAASGGVVSVHGFATAFNPNLPLSDSLGILNFNRDRLARFPLRQIWWMTPPVADIVLRALPDLSSWFLVRLHLTEVVPPPADAVRFLFSQDEHALVNLTDAERQADYLLDRFHRALNAGVPISEVSHLALATVQALEAAGASQQASRLAGHLIDQMASVFLPSVGNTLSRPSALDTSPWLHASLGEADVERAAVLNDIASLFVYQGHFNEAEPLFKATLETSKRVLGLEHPDTLISQNNLASIYNSQGRFSEAEPLFKATLETRQRVLGFEHPNTLTSQNNLAGVYNRQKRYSEAEPLLREVARVAEKVFGQFHPDVAAFLENHASVLQELGHVEEASAQRERAAVIRREHARQQGAR